MAGIKASLRDAHPSSPWLWRKDWASGLMRSSYGRTVLVVWVLAIAFSGLSAPVVIHLFELAKKEGIGVALMLSVFPITAVGLCGLAFRETARWLRFRGSQLQLDTLPGVVGGPFRATVHAGKLLAPEGDIIARLSCQQTARSGNETRSTTLWQDERSIPNSQLLRGPFGTAVQLAFEIPFESEPTSADPNRLPSVAWRLEVEAELEGADFHAVFDVPVFKTDESSAEISERFEPGAVANEDTIGFSDTSTEPLDDTRIAVSQAPDGSLEIHLPASRNRIGAFVLTAFAAFWNGFLYFAGRQMPGLFLFFLAPFVVVGLALVILVPFVWLQSTTLRARPGMLIIHSRILGMGSPRELPIEEIQAIAPEASGMNGSRASWSVQIHLKHRRSRAAVRNLRSKADAQRIAGMLMRAISEAD